MKKKPDPLIDPATAVALSDADWAALHVPRFKQMQIRYKAYERFLAKALKLGCQKLAPLCVVTTRAKGLASFAEKILRKRPMYTDPKLPDAPDPLVRMTDLCGGRVITHTSAEVEKVCAFIKAAFNIDWPNSEDTSRRLKPTEFGYRSVHYIVTVNVSKLRAAGVMLRVPPSILGLKTEIQVRTLLEHASADIGHDTLYKATMRVPDPIKRQFAAVAAVLEGTDREFGRLLSELNDLRSHHGAWHSHAEVVGEINRLRTVLQYEPRNEELAVRIGQLALAIGSRAEILSVLKPFSKSHNPNIKRLRGTTLTELNWSNPNSIGFTEGVSLLEFACADAPFDAETLCALAETYARRDDDVRAANLFQKALLADHTEPLSLSRFLEFEVARQGTDATVRLTEPIIHRSMDRCRREIAAGVNLPVAWSSLAIFQLLIGSPYDAMGSLAQVVTLCGAHVVGKNEKPQPCAAGRALLRIRETMRHLAPIREKLAGFDWIERFLLLALAVRVKHPEATKELGGLASGKLVEPHFKLDSLFVIISGGCMPDIQPAVNALRPHLRRAFEGLSCTLVAGGTQSGVSGLAGEIAAHSQGKIRAIGYLPGSLPLGVSADAKRFSLLVPTGGKDFSPLEPLQGWTDLITGGAEPSGMKLICFAGGSISKVEYAVALALGARVGFVESEIIPPERRSVDPVWQDHDHFVRLPLDTMTLRAFVQIDNLPLNEADLLRLERAARQAHEDYTKSATPKDDSLQPWDNLAPSLKLSNYHQVAYWERVLRDHGLGLRELNSRDENRRPLSMARLLGAKGISKLAEIEHGRWNVERLSLGWRYADAKDVPKKLSPYLVPWKNVPKNIQKYDLEAIRTLPKKLQQVGLELYKL
jgi:ppGpp synthetase/RelA/SpoT-type nucleotidyltranferase